MDTSEDPILFNPVILVNSSDIYSVVKFIGIILRKSIGIQTDVVLLQSYYFRVMNIALMYSILLSRAFK